jgi:hypothetical protein
VEIVTIQLTTVSKFKDTLAYFWNCSINFVEKEDDRMFTSILEPIGGIEGGPIVSDAGKTNQVAFGHLRGSPLNNGKTHLLSNLIDDLALTNSMATSKQHRLLDVQNKFDDVVEGFEIDGHCFLLKEVFPSYESLSHKMGGLSSVFFFNK